MKKQHNVVYKIDDLIAKYPGPITNVEICKSIDKYLYDNNAEDPTNLNIKKTLKERKDYIMMMPDARNLLKDAY